MDNKRFKVKMSDTYPKVYERRWKTENTVCGYDVNDEFCVYEGTLADCEAYIRLVESGYMG